MPSARGGADSLVPARNGQLRCKDGGAGLIALLTDFPDFATLGFTQRRHGPVVDNQDIDSGYPSPGFCA